MSEQQPSSPERQALEEILRLTQEEHDGWIYLDRRAVAEICAKAGVSIPIAEKNSLDRAVVLGEGLMKRMHQIFSEATDDQILNAILAAREAYRLKTPDAPKSGEDYQRNTHIFTRGTGTRKSSMLPGLLERLREEQAKKNKDAIERGDLAPIRPAIIEMPDGEIREIEQGSSLTIFCPNTPTSPKFKITPGSLGEVHIEDTPEVPITDEHLRAVGTSGNEPVPVQKQRYFTEK